VDKHTCWRWDTGGIREKVTARAADGASAVFWLAVRHASTERWDRAERTFGRWAVCEVGVICICQVLTQCFFFLPAALRFVRTFVLFGARTAFWQGQGGTLHTWGICLAFALLALRDPRVWRLVRSERLRPHTH
jgi:hypothetical protein